MDQAPIRVGTSAFTAAGWEGSFYPQGLPEREQLSYYAQHFDTVEVDSTFYRMPSLSTVNNWDTRTPQGFIFAAKVPQIITHEKVMIDCDKDLMEFLKVMSVLGAKLGPLLFQFPYFNKNAFAGVTDFLARLTPFLRKLPAGYKFAVEIRNKNWLMPRFADTLRSHGVALTLIDQAWMPQAAQWFEKVDPITADFTYVRWLGDRKGIEQQTEIWNKVIVDRQRELSEWVEALEKVAKLRIPIYAYANNHYAGFGPATVEMFRKLWNATSEQKLPSFGGPARTTNQIDKASSGRLFE
ncbi:MAG: DUF72 domain-containing protein [Candidatus Acidiferrales bacterium]|jgi:uncharacterized protein YecE (DUF72 family)